jgi:hypothetical protein
MKTAKIQGDTVSNLAPLPSSDPPRFTLPSGAVVDIKRNGGSVMDTHMPDEAVKQVLGDHADDLVEIMAWGAVEIDGQRICLCCDNSEIVSRIIGEKT